MTDLSAQTPLAADFKASEALRVRRLFTTPGVHPFDTVEWEIRDAVIGEPPASRATSLMVGLVLRISGNVTILPAIDNSARSWTGADFVPVLP